LTTGAVYAAFAATKSAPKTQWILLKGPETGVFKSPKNLTLPANFPIL